MSASLWYWMMNPDIFVRIFDSFHLFSCFAWVALMSLSTDRPFWIPFPWITRFFFVLAVVDGQVSATNLGARQASITFVCIDVGTLRSPVFRSPINSSTPATRNPLGIFLSSFLTGYQVHLAWPLHLNLEVVHWFCEYDSGLFEGSLCQWNPPVLLCFILLVPLRSVSLSVSRWFRSARAWRFSVTVREALQIDFHFLGELQAAVSRTYENVCSLPAAHFVSSTRLNV